MNTQARLADPPPALLDVAQLPQLARLFEQVFGHALDPALAAWKYGPGRGLSIGMHDAHDSSRLIAHCGLMFRDVLAFGEAASAGQLTDLMVAPDSRGRLLRRGSPFARVVSHALALLGSQLNPRNPGRLTFAFPSARAMKLAEVLGLVREIDQVRSVAWSARPGPRPDTLAAADTHTAALVDSLWARMRAEHLGGLLGVRSGAYFLARYLRHPSLHYQLHLVRDAGGEPLAVFATRQQGTHLWLSDWVGPAASLGPMVLAARTIAAEAGVPGITTWMTTHYAEHLAAHEGHVETTEFRIICRGDLVAADFERQQGRWWLTPGDTDYL